MKNRLSVIGQGYPLRYAQVSNVDLLVRVRVRVFQRPKLRPRLIDTGSLLPGSRVFPTGYNELYTDGRIAAWLDRDART